MLVEVLVALDAELVDALDAAEDALDDVLAAAFGAIGMKLLLPVPKPRAAASLPLPSTVTSSLSFLAVMTRLPLPLIEAVTKAGPELMALIRSAIVSVPVDVYLVMLVPSSTLNVPPGRNPRLDSEVLVVSGTVPVPVAGVGVAGAEFDVGAAAALDDDVEVDVEVLDEPPRALCTAADNSESTRFKAVLLAMLARPFPRFVSAWAITLISEASALEA